MARPKRICSVPDCGKRCFGHGYCQAHYLRWRRNGDPLAGRTPNGEPDRYLREVVLTYEGNECLFWPYGTNEGRACLRSLEGTGLVHRYVCERRHGPPPAPNYDAAHSCGNGHLGCVAQAHLSWKTRLENVADMVVHGTYTRGEKRLSSKLTEANVRLIKSLRGTASEGAIAAQFGVSRGTINAIYRNLNWSWLE